MPTAPKATAEIAKSKFAVSAELTLLDADDPPNPILIYGKQKVQIENFIKDNFDDEKKFKKT